jgi:leucyl aminopeptidase
MYVKQLKSQVADIKNTGGRPAGCITAAEYLHKFVGEVPWAHLDIAGTAWDFTEKSYIPKGPSGVGVRTLIELLRQWENGILATDNS